MEPINCMNCANTAAQKIGDKLADEPSEWVEIVLALLPTILECFQGGFSDLQGGISFWDRARLNGAIRRSGREQGKRFRGAEVRAIREAILETAEEIDEPTFNAMRIEAEF